jgi:2-oxoglutarate ferredoxin oxidoreductase subunit alpha
MVLTDGTIGQMMEPVDYGTMPWMEPPDKSEWQLDEFQEGRERHVLTSIWLDPADMAVAHEELIAKYEKLKKEDVSYNEYYTDDAELLIVAIGSPSRVTHSAIRILREEGLKVGLLRPITVWPFPYDIVREYAESDRVKAMLVPEMNWGQMIEDVKLAVLDKKPVHFVPKHGGLTFTPEDLTEPIRAILENPENPDTLWHIS